MGPDDSENLQEQIAELRQRVQQLERTLIENGIKMDPRGADRTPRSASAAQRPAAETSAAPPPAPIGTSWSEPAHPPAAVPSFAAVETPGSDGSLESRIGSQWFNRIGILAVLIGVAWFLKFAFDNHWIGPLGRVLIGLVGGAGLIGWSERFRTHRYVAFSYSLKAIGSGVLYLSLWAAFSVYHLVGSPVAFVAMIVVTAFNGFLAWAQDAELLALYAIVGGFATPLLLSTGQNHEVVLFSYLLVMDAAVLALVALKAWSRLLASAFLGTVLFFLSWWAKFYVPGEFATTAFFLACFFLIFAFAPRLVSLRESETESLSAWDALAVVVTPLANAALGFLGFYLLVDSVGSTWAQPWLAVEFAVFYLLMLRLPPRGGLRGSPAALKGLYLAIAVVFLTIAIPLKTQGRWLTIGWLAEGGALMWVAARTELRLLRVLAALCLLLGLGALVVINPAASVTPFFNERFGTYCVGIATCAFVAWVAARVRPESEGFPAFFPAFGWRPIAACSAIAVNVLILLAMGWEIHSYWWYLSYRGDWHPLHDYQMYAQFTYSAFFMLFGAVLLGIGFWRRSAFLRWQALVLLAASIGKVFIVDVEELSQGYRILSFLGLGALLLAVSFAYQRDWLNLRGAEHKTT